MIINPLRKFKKPVDVAGESSPCAPSSEVEQGRIVPLWDVMERVRERAGIRQSEGGYWPEEAQDLAIEELEHCYIIRAVA